MIGFMRRHIRRAHGDDGIALVAAIALMGLVGALIAALVAVAMAETRSTGRDRQRSQAVMAAEQRVDSIVALIQSTPLADLPCDSQTTLPVSVGSDDLSVQAEVQYYDSTVSTDVPLGCADVRAGTAVPDRAAISAKAVSDPLLNEPAATRTVEVLLRLEPVFSTDMEFTILGYAGVTLANRANILGTDGQPNADLYSNGDVICNNNQEFHGSIYAQGSVFLQGQCVVMVDVHAKAGITVTSPSSNIGGQALVSNGNIQLNKAGLGQQARASGTALSTNGTACSGTPSKCFSGVTVPPPPKQDFPVWNWYGSESKWTSNGYTGFQYFPQGQFGCGMYNGSVHSLNGKVSGVTAWLAIYGPGLSQDTVLYANCPADYVRTQNNVGITIGASVAIFATGGINFSGNTQITSATATHHDLYLIQPYDSMTLGCEYDGIVMDNQVTVDPTVDVLMYSPCDIRKANLSNYFGQIYAGGEVLIDNQIQMEFKPLPAFGRTESTVVESFDAEIMYKRENV